MSRIGRAIDNLIFPLACPFCGELLEKSKGYVCIPCRISAPYITEPSCLKCGCEIQDESAELCEDCRRIPQNYVKGFPLMSYEGACKNALLDFKYRNMRCNGEYFAKEIYRKYGTIINSLDIDVLVPVPVHKSRKLERGYNQAEVLAKELGRLFDIPVDSNLIKRDKKTVALKSLNDQGREETLKNAFISNQKQVKYKSAMIVDDIYTTGATIRVCSDVLKNYGVLNVYYTSVGIGRG